ncbi:MAG: hypothetical protein ABI867_23265 [Kofleriaceae bacterium]
MVIRSLLLVSFLAACGGGGGEDPVTPDSGPIPEGWQPLITKAWSLAPHSEDTSDLEIVSIRSDVFVGGIRPIAPPGTHHTLLARGSVASPNIVYASGVGTNELVFPAGTGLKLESGELLALQLHVFNPGETPIEGTSGIEVLYVDPLTIQNEADLLLAGPDELSIGAGSVTQTGTCTITQQQTLFALFPHMHQLGTHLKTTITRAGVPMIIHDSAYSFDEQAFLELSPIVVEPGDKVTTECTFVNTTGQVVEYGESSTSEMCYSILYRFPAVAGDFCSR